MKLNWILLMAGGLGSVMFGQQYPQQNSPYQGDPNYNGQYGNNQTSGQYAGDPNYDSYSGDPAYNDGAYAPAPPPIPNYAYQRPPMPGPEYLWVDGYWDFLGGQYSWVNGYWSIPPYAGEYWIAPRYSGGRFFLGYWSGGGRRDYNRGFVGNEYRRAGRVESPRQNFSAPRVGSGAPSRDFTRGSSNNDHQGQGRVQAPRQSNNTRPSESGFRAGNNHGSQAGNAGQRGGRR